MLKTGLEDSCFAGAEHRSNHGSRRHLHLVLAVSMWFSRLAGDVGKQQREDMEKLIFVASILVPSLGRGPQMHCES